MLAESGVELAALLPRTRRHGVARPQGRPRRTSPTIPPERVVPPPGVCDLRGGAFGPSRFPLLGADSCMWASDYPHTDSTFPESRRVIDETLGVLTPEDRRKVTAHQLRRAVPLGGRVLSPQPGAVARLRPRRAADARRRRDGGVLPRARPRRRRDAVPRGGPPRRPDDQLPPRRDVAARRLHPAGTRRGPAVRRSLLRVGRIAGRRCTPRSTTRAPTSSKVRCRDAARAAWRRRACTCATLTATSWNS